ncbi:MAG: hypothetical protein K0B15_11770 [Lentimicrobium sp.]|nr:hypothetical protein [Lentimicrobium sp.]
MVRSLSIYIVLTAIVALLLFLLMAEIKSNYRLKDNYSALLSDISLQQTVTNKEYKKLYSEIDRLTRELGLKPKQIIQIVQTTYTIKDTVTFPLSGDTTYLVRNDTVFSIIDTLRFNIERPCYKLSGWIYDSKIHENLLLKDKTSVVIYRERPNKLLFVKFGRWRYSALFHSECSGHMKVDNNIVIQKKR